VNDDSELQKLATEFQDQGCAGPVLCGQCPNPPSYGYCGEGSVCMDVNLIAES
jgi:hypothetical protein